MSPPGLHRYQTWPCKGYLLIFLYQSILSSHVYYVHVQYVYSLEYWKSSCHAPRPSTTFDRHPCVCPCRLPAVKAGAPTRSGACCTGTVATTSIRTATGATSWPSCFTRALTPTAPRSPPNHCQVPSSSGLLSACSWSG